MPSFNDMVVKACAIALREHPRANGAYRDGKVELYSRVNVGVAVAAQDALVVPTVFDADLKGLRQIATETRALAAARPRGNDHAAGALGRDVHGLEPRDVRRSRTFAAVINPPQAAILAVGAIDEKPVVRDGEITTAHLMAITLACDHRILYGADGAEFLGAGSGPARGAARTGALRRLPERRSKLSSCASCPCRGRPCSGPCRGRR